MEIFKSNVVGHDGKADLFRGVNSFSKPKGKSCRASRRCKMCNRQTLIHDAYCKPKDQTEDLAASLLASLYGRTGSALEHLTTNNDVNCYDEASDLFLLGELEEKCIWIAEEYYSRAYTCKVVKKSVYRERQQRIRIRDNPEEDGKQLRFSCSTELMLELQKSSSSGSRTKHERRPLSKKECRHLFYWHVQLENQGANTESKLKQRGLVRRNVRPKQTAVCSSVKEPYVLRKSAPSHSTFGKTIGDFLVNLQYRDITPEDYDMLLQLEETIRPKSLSHKRICALESLVVNSLHYSADVCCICLEPFKLAQRLTVLPVCRHEFHEFCISSWLSVQSTKCPLDGLEV